jgi:hypothetical protein
MNPVIVAAIITGACAIIAAIIGALIVTGTLVPALKASLALMKRMARAMCSLTRKHLYLAVGAVVMAVAIAIVCCRVFGCGGDGPPTVLTRLCRDAAGQLTVQEDDLEKYPDGKTTLRLDYDESHPGDFHCLIVEFAEPLDMTNVEEVTIWVKGGQGGEEFEFKVEDSHNNKPTPIVLTALPSWQRIAVTDLESSFPNVDLGSVARIVVGFNEKRRPPKGTIYMAKIIRLSGLPDVHIEPPRSEGS